MHPSRFLLPLTLLLAFTTPLPAKSWKPIPLDQVIDRSPAIVVGSICRIQQRKLNNHDAFVATLQITETFRGAAPNGPLQFIEISWPDLGPGKTHPGMTYKLGDEGIWILSPRFGEADPAHPNLYSAERPESLQPLAKRDEIEKILSEQALRLLLSLDEFETPLANQAPSRIVRLFIDNRGPAPLTLNHPANRSALTFIVLDEHHNIIAPTPRGKADPANNKPLTLHPGRSHLETLHGLEFVTGTALFGYDLHPGKTYRITALYRPDGPNSPAVASTEKVITLK